MRIDSWRLPTSASKRERLATVYGQDALALLRAVYAEQSPDWLAELPAVETLRMVLLQNYYISSDTRGAGGGPAAGGPGTGSPAGSSPGEFSLRHRCPLGGQG